MNKKSITELLSDSFATFKESFWGIATTYLVALVLIIIAAVILPKSFFTSMQQKGLSTDNIASSTISYIFSLILMVWQTIIIRNNIFSGQSKLFEALKESFPKAFKFLLITFIIGIILVPVFIIISDIKICAVLMPFFAIPALIGGLPFLLMITLGIILRDGNLKEIVISSFGVALNYFLPIAGRISVIIFLNIAIYIVLIIPFFIFGALSSILLSPSISFLLIFFIIYFIIYIFTNCYFIEMYIDFATENKHIDIDEELLIETPIEDVNQPLPQPQPTQQIVQEQPPEGLRPLGGDYKNNNQQ